MGCAVVFGRVLEGMPVVRSIEAMGSSSGKTRQKVAIGDCGELPSRRQILAKMAAEKEALANMKKDPLQVYSDFLPITLNDSTCRVCHDRLMERCQG